MCIKTNLRESISAETNDFFFFFYLLSAAASCIWNEGETEAAAALEGLSLRGAALMLV